MLVERILHSHNVTNVIVLQERFKAASLLGSDGEPVSTSELRRRVRARQNVSLEYGWFWGRLGRKRVLLLIKGELELPSDLAGLSYYSYKISPEECQEAIAEFVEGFGISEPFPSWLCFA